MTDCGGLVVFLGVGEGKLRRLAHKLVAVCIRRNLRVNVGRGKVIAGGESLTENVGKRINARGSRVAV